MTVALQQKSATDEDEHRDPTRQHAGKWVLIHNGCFVGAFACYGNAEAEGLRQFGLAPFSVRMRPSHTANSSIAFGDRDQEGVENPRFQQIAPLLLAAAGKLIERFGKDAEIEVATRADDCLASGDEVDRTTWLLVLDAIRDLRNGQARCASCARHAEDATTIAVAEDLA